MQSTQDLRPGLHSAVPTGLRVFNHVRRARLTHRGPPNPGRWTAEAAVPTCSDLNFEISKPALRSGALRVSPDQFVDPSVDYVGAVVGEEHVGALSGDDFDLMVAAEGEGGFCDGASGAGAVEPDAAHAGLGAVGDGGSGGGGGRHQERGFDGRLDVGDAGVTVASVDLGGVGVDGEDVVSAAEEF